MTRDIDRGAAPGAGARFSGRLSRLTLAMAVIGPALTLVGVVAPAAGASSSTSVTITRDSDGVPHIKAANFTALGYGEAWAFSQDNFCTLAQDFVTVNGERSRYFGPNAMSLNYSAGAEDSNLDSDLYWQSVKASGIVDRDVHEAPPTGRYPRSCSSTGASWPATTPISAPVI